MSALWSGLALIGALDARVEGVPPAGAVGVSIDTRTLGPGDLFVALAGERDGHDFVAHAFRRGAAAAVVDEARAPGLRDAGGPLYVVRDVMRALEALGRAGRARTRARVVAVTGSVGKTGTKEALRLALSRQGATHASVASYNNHWGVPLTLARMPAASRYGVFEVGMNHSGEILPLTAMVRPHAALVTAVEPVHLEHFPSVAAIADAKGEVFDGLEPGGTAVINADNPFAARLRAHAGASRAGRVLAFGAGEGADFRLVRTVPEADGQVVGAVAFGRPLAFRLGSPGRHAALNALGALALVHAIGADVNAAALALAEARPPGGRGARVELHLPGTAERPAGTVALLDESYNANPASVRAALDVLAAASVGPGGRRLAALGDMLELGEGGPAMHAALAEAVAMAGVDAVFLAGPLMRHLAGALPPSRVAAYEGASADLLAPLAAALRPGDALVVKGSNGSRMGPLVAALRARFPDPAGAPTPGAPAPSPPA